MKNITSKITIKRALPIIVAAVVAAFQAIADQNDSAKIEELEQRVKVLEKKEG